MIAMRVVFTIVVVMWLVTFISAIVNIHKDNDKSNKLMILQSLLSIVVCVLAFFSK